MFIQFCWFLAWTERWSTSKWTWKGGKLEEMSTSKIAAKWHFESYSCYVYIWHENKHTDKWTRHGEERTEG